MAALAEEGSANEISAKRTWSVGPEMVGDVAYSTVDRAISFETVASPDGEGSIIIAMQPRVTLPEVQVTPNIVISDTPGHVMTSEAQIISVPQNIVVSDIPISAENVTLEIIASNQGDNFQTTSLNALRENDKPTSPCLVCGDAGSGCHYSVFSCEGCKGFFKRTVQKNLIYVCKEQGECYINKYTRNSCQACRFLKCLQMGMKRDAVREDRTPGGKHRVKKMRVESPDAASVDYCDELIDLLIEAQPDLIPQVEGDLTHVNITANDMMQYGYMELKFIIDWAKKVPGFLELAIDDQMALLKSSFMELNVLRISYRSVGLLKCVKFAEGLVLPMEAAANIGWGTELLNASLEFAARLKELSMDHTEFCILNGLVLTYPDASGIIDRTNVNLLQIRILDSLRSYIVNHYPNDTRRYGKVLLRLPSLRTLSAKAAERFLSLTLDGTIPLNNFVSEMMT